MDICECVYRLPFLFLYHIFVVLRYKKSHRALAMAKTKPQNPKHTNKGNIRSKSLQLGSVPVPGPHMGAKLKQVN